MKSFHRHSLNLLNVLYIRVLDAEAVLDKAKLVIPVTRTALFSLPPPVHGVWQIRKFSLGKFCNIFHNPKSHL